MTEKRVGLGTGIILKIRSRQVLLLSYCTAHAVTSWWYEGFVFWYMLLMQWWHFWHNHNSCNGILLVRIHQIPGTSLYVNRAFCCQLHMMTSPCSLMICTEFSPCKAAALYVFSIAIVLFDVNPVLASAVNTTLFVCLALLLQDQWMGIWLHSLVASTRSSCNNMTKTTISLGINACQFQLPNEAFSISHKDSVIQPNNTFQSSSLLIQLVYDYITIKALFSRYFAFLVPRI